MSERQLQMPRKRPNSRTIIFLVWMLAIGGLLGQAMAQAGGSIVLAKVGDMEITAAELESFLAILPFHARGQYLTADGRRNLVEKLIAEELFYQEALQQGLEREPAFIRHYRSLEDSLLHSSLLKQLPPQDKAPNGVEAAADFLTACRQRSIVSINRVNLAQPLVDDPQVVLAAIDNEQITMADVYAIVGEYSPPSLPNWETVVGREALLGKLIDRTLMSLEARRRGLDRQPEVVARLEDIKRTLLTSRYRSSLLSRVPSTVTEEERRAFYNNNPELFVVPEKVRVRLILVRIDRESTEAEKVAAKEKIDRAAAELKNKAAFAVVAQRYSEEAGSRDRGGLLPAYPQGVRGEEFDRVAFSISTPGQISEIYLDKRGYQILQLVERINQRQEDYNEARAVLERRVRNEKQKEAERTELARLRQKYAVTVFEDHLQNLQLSAGKE